MIRKAIVIVPSDEDYKARIEAQEKEETKDVPDNAVMEMKGIENITNYAIVTLKFWSCNGTLKYPITNYHFKLLGPEILIQFFHYTTN